MALPFGNVTYSNKETSNNWESVLRDAFDQVKQKNVFFFSLCNNCRITGTKTAPLNRCAGCQIVSYCSRGCQKADRSIHRYVCKDFPIINGNNALQTKIPWEKHLSKLRDRAALLPEKAAASAMSIFRNPRVCNTCHEARQDRLEDCSYCKAVTYCSTKCLKADKKHNNDCLYLIYSVFQNYDIKGRFKMFIDDVSDEFTPLSSWEELKYVHMRIDLNVNVENMRIILQMYIKLELMSHPMSLLYALQTLPDRKLGSDNVTLEECTTLTVHVVTSSPVFASKPWEMLMHRLPKLQALNVVFVMHGKPFTPVFKLNNNIGPDVCCSDCDEKKRWVTFSIKQMQYHMFFSSEEYTVPDIVYVIGASIEMPGTEKESLHSEISYSNMTYNRDTLLILSDATMNIVEDEVRAVQRYVGPIEQLVKPQPNPFFGSSSNRSDIDSKTRITNDKQYFCCLKRK